MYHKCTRKCILGTTVMWVFRGDTSNPNNSARSQRIPLKYITYVVAYIFISGHFIFQFVRFVTLPCLPNKSTVSSAYQVRYLLHHLFGSSCAPLHVQCIVSVVDWKDFENLHVLLLNLWYISVIFLGSHEHSSFFILISNAPKFATIFLCCTSIH